MDVEIGFTPIGIRSLNEDGGHKQQPSSLLV
jgi:hypothetical protein